MQQQKILIFAITALLIPVTLLAQNDYSHGHGALQVFNQQGFANTPKWVQGWIIVMLSSFASGLFFVKNHPIARWVVGGFVLGALSGNAIAAVLGLPLLSGYIALVHLVFWSPGLYQLLSKRPFKKTKSAFSIWSGVITGVILFSFVFDIRDAFLYVQHLL